MTTSEQARADAMADAETLLEFVGEKLQYHSGFRMARDYGDFAVYTLQHLKPRAYKARAQAIEFSIIAARAAFRAVPGLRGDK